MAGMRRNRMLCSKLIFLFFFLLFAAQLHAQPSPLDNSFRDKVSSIVKSVIPDHQRESAWFKQAQKDLKNKINCEYCFPKIAAAKKAKNIILFVGDGMGVSTVTAARIFAGQQAGGLGEEYVLSFETLPYTGLVKTYNVDAQVPDSAGSMTAMVAGVKTNFGVLSVSENTIRGDCASQQGKELITAFELAELAGMSTGIVSTARITHATPAANYAKSVERDWEYKTSDINCDDIAQQLITFSDRLRNLAGSRGLDVSTKVDGVDVVFGGGKHGFVTEPNGGKREDKKDLLQHWLQQSDNRVIVDNASELRDVEITSNTQLFGLFANSHMAYEMDRVKNHPTQPSLSEMTIKALELLSKNEDGYFLQVESGRIDHGHHAGSAVTALSETVEFSNALQVVLDRIDLSETLLIVTADHSHVMTMAGYSKRGNDILGYVDPLGSEDGLAEDGLPYTTLSYTNGRGVHHLGDETDADKIYKYPPVAGRAKEKLEVAATGYHQEALVPLQLETHGGEDVAIYAAGPGAHLVSGVLEQNLIFHIINYAADLEVKALERH